MTHWLDETIEKYESLATDFDSCKGINESELCREFVAELKSIKDYLQGGYQRNRPMKTYTRDKDGNTIVIQDKEDHHPTNVVKINGQKINLDDYNDVAIGFNGFFTFYLKEGGLMVYKLSDNDDSGDITREIIRNYFGKN